MDSFRLERFAPLAGVGFAILILAGRLLVFTYPDANASAEETVDFWTDKESQLFAVAILGTFGGMLFVWFAGSLYERIKSGERGDSRMAALCLAGGVLTSAMIFVEESLVFTTAETAGDVPDTVTQTLSALQADFFLPLLAGFAVFFAAAGIGLLRSRAMSRWVGWTAVVLAVLWILPNPGVIFLTFVWCTVVGVLLFLRPAESAAVPS